MTGTTSLLRVGGIDAGYGDVKVLYDVSVSIEPGAITALVGSNAAGKTTLMRAISGLIPVTRGTIEFDSVDVTRNRPSDRVLAGICLVPEGRMIFSDLSVEENLAIGAFIPRVRAERRQLVEELYERYPVLRQRRLQKGGTLSGGEQQMLAIARGLMSRPRLLLLDEPSLGLAPKAVAFLFDVIREINASGVTIMLVEQNVRTTLEVADYAYVLENGRIAMHGGARGLLDDPRVRQAYLGM